MQAELGGWECFLHPSHQVCPFRVFGGATRRCCAQSHTCRGWRSPCKVAHRDPRPSSLWLPLAPQLPAGRVLLPSPGDTLPDRMALGAASQGCWHGPRDADVGQRMSV